MKFNHQGVCKVVFDIKATSETLHLKKQDNYLTKVKKVTLNEMLREFDAYGLEYIIQNETILTHKMKRNTRMTNQIKYIQKAWNVSHPLWMHYQPLSKSGKIR